MDSYTSLYIIVFVLFLVISILSAFCRYLRIWRAKQEARRIVVGAPVVPQQYHPYPYPYPQQNRGTTAVDYQNASNWQVTYNPAFTPPEANPSAPYPVQQYSVVGAGANNPAFATESSRVNYQFRPSPFVVNEPPPSYYEVAAADATETGAQPKPPTQTPRRNSTPS